MKFGPVPIAQALGTVLAHKEALPDGALPKGHILTQPDLDRLAAAGWQTVTVASLDPEDIDENAAAAALAAALTATATGLRLSHAATGRVNIVADTPGLAALDVAALHRLNRIDPMITVATVPDLHRMDRGGLVATVKIIAYAVPRGNLEQAITTAKGAIGLHRPVIASAALIESRVGRDLGDKGMQALQTRLARLDVGFEGRTYTAHTVEALAAALRSSTAPLIFILTGSATSDIRDTAPAALQQAGGSVHHFGMPVDPGNLLFLGALDERPVIGLPGCARSIALNGADWVLERVICGHTINVEDFAAMGVGGLLKEIPSRPHPRRMPGLSA